MRPAGLPLRTGTRRLRRWGWTLLVAGTLSLAGRAQSPTPPQFRAGTTLVEVSAIVTRDGQPVTDLRRDEVTVLDNGVPQPLVAFEYVDLGSGEAPDQRRDFVLVMDDLHIQPRQTSAAIAAALRFVELLGPFDRLAVIFTAPPQGTVQLTTDRAEVRARIEAFRGQFEPQALMRARAAGASDEAEWRTRDALDVLKQVARAVRSDAGERRAVLLLSEGHPVFSTDFSAFGSRGAQALTSEFLALLGEAALANVAVYAVDPRGLRAQDTASTPSRTYDHTAAGPTLVGDLAGSLAALARNTGGLHTYWSNDVTKHFGRLLQDSRQYYRLAYEQPEPPPGKAQPRVRRVEVKVKQKGVEVRARQRYAPTPAAVATAQ